MIDSQQYRLTLVAEPNAGVKSYFETDICLHPSFG